MFISHDMAPFIDDLARRVPDEVHPAGKATISDWLREARLCRDEPAAVVNLLRKAAEKVAMELDWHAEKLERGMGLRRRITAETIELRQQARAWEAEASRGVNAIFCSEPTQPQPSLNQASTQPQPPHC
jgi:hypothetical protein